MSEHLSAMPCGCDPSENHNCQHYPYCAWGKAFHAGSSDGFCPCTEGAPCPVNGHVTEYRQPKWTDEGKVQTAPATTYTPLPGTLVIGLGHKARHGKDTTAQILVELFPQYVKRFALADALRCYCRVEHGMTVKDAPLLQKVGVDMRQKNPQVWIDTLYWTLVENAPRIAVITDVRFQNEATFVKQMGGILVKVQRVSPTTGEPFQASDRDPKHVSEMELEHYAWDHTIIASSVKELRSAAGNYFYPIINAHIG